MTSTDEHHALALDLGSSSVRAVLGTYRQGVISTEEVFRLHHQVVDDHGTLQPVGQPLATWSTK